jgi:hypothetical protein
MGLSVLVMGYYLWTITQWTIKLWSPSWTFALMCQLKQSEGSRTYLWLLCFCLAVFFRFRLAQLQWDIGYRMLVINQKDHSPNIIWSSTLVHAASCTSKSRITTFVLLSLVLNAFLLNCSSREHTTKAAPENEGHEKEKSWGWEHGGPKCFEHQRS